MIAILMRLGYLKNIYEISYSGKIFSLNDLYRQGHWTVRKKLKDKYRSILLNKLVESDLKFCNRFYLLVFYNTRHDPDNIIGIVKILVDSMKGKYTPDDNKKYFKGVSIFPDSSLEHGTVEFIIIEKR